MITQINKLKNFGIYQNYSWNTVDDFKKKNLIYGWNYSGKTTLSKLYQVLEFKDKNRHFSGSEIEITINDGATKTINQDKLHEFPYIVKVFNSEYISRIFTWDQPKTGFDAISFYLGDTAGDLKDKIKKAEIIISRLALLQNNKYQPKIDIFESYNKANGNFSKKAKEIRDNFLPNLFNPTTFDKGHFKAIADIVKTDLEAYILSPDERDITKTEATSSKTFEIQNENLAVKENLTTLTLKIKSILEESAPKSISFPILEEDSNLFDWVQKGITLHKDSTECKFCTNKLPKNRIEELNSFYSKRLKEIQDEIEKKWLE